MKLTVLSVAYPLAEVSPESVGGAEQVQLALDEALERSGHRSIVIACEGSRVRGTLLPISKPPAVLSDEAKSAAKAELRRAISHALSAFSPDLIHLGLSLLPAAPPDVPTLATLHLPPSWYPIFQLPRPCTYLHCVSRSTHQACPPITGLLSPIENGIPVDRLSINIRKREFALALVPFPR